MTSSAGRTRAQATSALLSAVVTGLASVLMGLIWSSPSGAQTCVPPFCDSSTTTTLDTTTSTSTPSEWSESHWTNPTNNGETVSNGTFSGTFVHASPTPPMETVDLTITYVGGARPAACGSDPTPPQQQTTTTSTPSPGETSSTMNFLFEVAFTCNGLYNATATGRLQGPQNDPVTRHDLVLTGLRVSEPPQSPLSFLATSNGNGTVTLAWQPPNSAPPDLAGYRVSRRDAAASDFASPSDVAPDVHSVTDTNIPASGGSYFYKVETLRTSPDGLLTSNAVITSEALVVGPAGTPGSSVGGVTVPQPGGGGDPQFDPTTLAADEGEPGEGDFAVPGAGTIQRFAGRDGAGLIKPFAAALDLAVWAGLLLFLTRRAASAERAAALAVEVEHPT